MSESREKIENFLMGAAFAFFVLITCYRLTYASLWFDEAVEYWYSKIMFGSLPFKCEGAENTVNMYQRIISTYQPPLYNIIMFFWLKISDSEWWFRFFGVVMGFIGMVGIYKTVKKISDNSLLSSGAVFFSSCIFQLEYYWQECAEYCLMLGSLCWTIYFWVCLIQNTNRRNIILFAIFSIIPIYSQYGAAFPIFAMCLLAYIFVLSKRNKKNIIEISVSYLGALICAALPLYLFFLKKQMLNQQEVYGTYIEPHSLWGNIDIIDFLKSMLTVFHWNLLPYYGDQAVRILLVIILLISLTILIWGRTLTKLLVVANAITCIFYYIAVKLAVYSYGDFGNRYNLFFIPLWIVFIFAIGYEIYCILQKIELLKRFNTHTIFAGVTISLIVCYNVLSWDTMLRNNWSKQDIRGTVNEWYQYAVSEKNTFVYYGAGPGFSYYVRLNEQYDDKTENSVVYMDWYVDKSVEEYVSYIDGVYGEHWPQEIYIVGALMMDDFNTLIRAFTENAYVSEDIYNSSGGRLIKLVYSQSN